MWHIILKPRVIQYLFFCQGNENAIRFVAGYVRMFLHTIRAQSQCVGTMYAHHCLSPLLLASTHVACSLHTVSHNTPPDPLSFCLCSQLSLDAIYGRSVCGGKAVPWLRGWASLWHLPHHPLPLRPMHPQEIRKAYPPTVARCDAGRTGRWWSGFGVDMDIRRFQAVNGDCLRRTLNVDCIGLIAPVENLIWADVRSLEGTPEGTVP